MGDHTAFFYGTLMAPEVLFRVCYGTSKPTDFQKSLLTIRPAILHAYSRHKVRYCDYPAVVPSDVPAGSTDQPQASESSVRGTYVTGLTDGDIWRLDIFEGYEYKRQVVNVKLLTEVGDETGKGNVEGETMQTQTYVWISEREKLEDGEWDFGNFVREKMIRWVGGSDEYEEVDEAVKEREAADQEADPTGGRGFGGMITAALERDGKAKDDVLGSAV